MAQPTTAQIHLDAALTNISVAYSQKADSFIASKVFPDVNVSKQSDKYFTYPKAAFQKDSMRKRAGGEESAGSGYQVSTDSYYCDVWALHKDISVFDRANTDSPLDADKDAVEFLTQQALIRKEVQWATDFFTTGVWATDNTTATDWDNYTSSHPLLDVDLAKETIRASTGQKANTLVLGLQVFNKLKNHPDIVDRIKYTSSRVVGEEILASLFGIERVLVAEAIVDLVAEGKTGAPGFIHGKNALLCHVAPSPGLRTPSAGYTINWTGLAPGFASQGVALDKFYLPAVKSDRIEIHCAFDQKVVGADLGYFWSSIVG